MSVSMCLPCTLFLVARQFKNPCDKKIEQTVHPYRDPTLEPGLGCLGLSPCGQARHSQKNMGLPSCRSNTHRRCHRGWVQCLLGNRGDQSPVTEITIGTWKKSFGLPRRNSGHLLCEVFGGDPGQAGEIISLGCCVNSLVFPWKS